MESRGADERRLRGWKVIAAYLSVTESTAIRWSKRPGFPVTRSLDGGSVYAFPSELDQWLSEVRSPPRPPEDEDSAPASIEAVRAPPSCFGLPTRRLWIAGGAAIFTGSVIAGLLLTKADRPPASDAAVEDPELEALYIDARADTAARTLESLNRAADKFRNIVARYPNFVPGFTGLADTYILSCEFGSTDRSVAFRDARAAVSTALALSPNDVDANRIMGFLTYWTTRDIAASRHFFSIAVRGDHVDHLGHLWFGNALIDAGRLAEGLEHLRRAMVLDPDSPSVLTDYAMALWQAGKSQASLSRLSDVETRFPTHSAAPSAAALYQLQIGDVAAYLDQSRRWATLIGDAGQTARIATEAATLAAGGARATLILIARSTPLVSSFWHGGELPVAMAASMIGDRERVRTILSAVADRGVTWRNLRFPAESFLRWKDDSELRRLLRLVLDPGDFPDFPKG